MQLPMQHIPIPQPVQHLSLVPGPLPEGDSPTSDLALSDRIRAACKGMTVAGVSRATGFHPETVRRYLGGQRPSVNFVALLADRLGLSTEWLLLGRGQMKAESLTT